MDCRWFRPVFNLFFFGLLLNSALSAVIVIDPGHGGVEGGAEAHVWLQGKKIHLIEKNLSLQIAQRLADILRPHHNVYLTRSYDKNISLQDRAVLAETTKADLFVSVHINASTDAHSQGYETYYLSPGQDQTIRKIEDKENVGIGSEQVVINQILIDLIVDKMTPASRALAKSIHSELNLVLPQKYKVKNRGMKPALFYVLALSKRPSVLLEAGFLSNAHEGAHLYSRQYQQDYAQAVAKGILKYLKNDGKI